MHPFRNTVYTPHVKTPTRDRFTAIYAVAAFLVFLFGDIANEFDEIYQFPVPVFLFGMAALTLIVTASAFLIINLVRLRWKQMVSIIAAPIVIAPLYGLNQVGIDMDWVVFQFRKGAMMEDVARIEASSDQPVVITWGWGETGGAAVPNVEWTMIYDRSDEVATPPISWSPEFRERVKRAENDNSRTYGFAANALFSVEQGDQNTSLTKMGGHFYLAEEFIN